MEIGEPSRSAEARRTETRFEHGPIHVTVVEKVLLALLLAAQCQCRPREAQMAMTQLAEADFKLPVDHAGTRCEAVFFRGFSGYTHPIRPVHPMTWREALRGSAFSVATYCPAAEGPRLVKFVGLRWTRVAVDLIEPIRADGTHERYFVPAPDGDRLRAGRELEPGDAFVQREFLYASVPEGAEVISRVERVKLDTWLSYEYAYDAKGAIERAVIRNSGGAHNVLERGKPAQILPREKREKP